MHSYRCYTVLPPLDVPLVPANPTRQYRVTHGGSLHRSASVPLWRDCQLQWHMEECRESPPRRMPPPRRALPLLRTGSLRRCRAIRRCLSLRRHECHRNLGYGLLSADRLETDSYRSSRSCAGLNHRHAVTANTGCICGVPFPGANLIPIEAFDFGFSA